MGSKTLEKNKRKSMNAPDSNSMKTRILRWVIDIALIIVGAVCYSAGIHCFTDPYDIAPGGVAGISTILNELFGVNIGLMYGLINVPLVILGFVLLGKKLMIKTLISVATITFSTDYLLVYVPVYENGDKIIAAIFGGVLMGAGLGLTYLREGTSGGTDIINKIINKAMPHVKLGVITLMVDFVIIIASMLVFKNVETGLYAAIAIFISTRVLDMILYGSYEGKMLLIFSDSYQDIADMIMVEFNRGVTFLMAKGGYSGADKNVICCAVHKNEYAKIKRKVKDIDRRAFIIISSVAEVFGEGFKENE